jgi:hypothetical protein
MKASLWFDISMLALVLVGAVVGTVLQVVMA